MSERELFLGDGKLVSLPRSPVVQEEDLEKLILRNPNLLALPGESHRLFVVRNQFPISDDEVKNRYALDILMVRDDAVPVLVEVKRCVDTRIKREVVAQMLDYACYLENRYNHEDLQGVFRAEGNQNRDEYEKYANDDAFWRKVSENLSCRNMVLVFAADEIPKSLLDLIDYLQQSFPKTIVYGVEIKEYKASSEAASVFERNVHYTQKQQSGEKPRVPAHPWTAESYLQYTNQHYPELTDTVRSIMERFTEKYYTKFGAGNVYATFYAFDRPSGNQLFSMYITENSALLWFPPTLEPLYSLLRTDPCIQNLPADQQPKETRKFIKLDVHALQNESVKNWLFSRIDELFQPE